MKPSFHKIYRWPHEYTPQTIDVHFSHPPDPKTIAVFELFLSHLKPKDPQSPLASPIALQLS